jgi:hypothetical protein
MQALVREIRHVDGELENTLSGVLREISLTM